MAMLRNLALLVAAFALSAGTAEAGKGGKKNGHHELRGVVVSVEADGFTIKTHAKKGGKGKANGAKGAGNPGKAGGKAGKGGQLMKVSVTAQTQFTVVQKKQGRAVPAGALRVGEHVAVATSDGHTATKVMIHHGKKKNGKKQK